MQDKLIFSLNQKSPTFIATADVHLGKKLYNMPELEEDFRESLVKLADLAIERKVQYLLVAGDLFEDNALKPYMIAFVAQQVARLAKEGIKLIGIAGDHDKPLKGESWYRISGITPASAIPEFAGIDYFDYSSVEPADIVKLLKENKDPDKVRWIVLHCQFPQVFSLGEPKKLIDFNQLDLFTHFPKLQGIIAGDLHFGPQTKAYGVNKEAFVGYPGSLNVTDIKEAENTQHVFYCDGNTLTEIPHPPRRKMVRIQFRGDKAKDFDISEYEDMCKTEKFKPVFVVYWDRTSEQYMRNLFPLYSVGLVHLHQMAVGSKGDAIETVSDRAEVSTEDKIEKAMRECCDKDEGLLKLAIGLVTTTEPKALLDEFKKEFNL